MIGTFSIILAFTTNTAGQCIAGITGRTGAYRPFLVASIVPGRTDSIRTTRIRTAQIFLREWTTADKRIASHITRTTADRRQTAQITVGIHTARTFAWIFANAIDTGRSTSWTIPIAKTFRPTLTERATDVPFRAFADCPMVRHPGTGRTFATLITSVDALELATVLIGATFYIRFTLVPTAGQWRANISRQTGTGRNTVDHVTLGV